MQEDDPTNREVEQEKSSRIIISIRQICTYLQFIRSECKAHSLNPATSQKETIIDRQVEGNDNKFLHETNAAIGRY